MTHVARRALTRVMRSLTCLWEKSVKLPTWITFDCYDTLVEFPIDRVTREILGARADDIDIDEFLAAFEALRFRTTTSGPVPALS